MRCLKAGIILGGVSMLVAGCATPSQQMLLLQNENETLKQDVSAKAAQIMTLTDEKAHLQKELDYCTKRGDVLVKEKTARLDEVALLRKGIQEFTEEMRQSLEAYCDRADIVDYLGNELLPRSITDTQKHVLLVDLTNPVKENGTVIGGRAWISNPTRIQFCLLRHDAENNRYIVVHLSPELAATEPGLQSWSFLAMAARKGDLVGVYAPEDVSIPYDDVDTGEVVAIPGGVKLNSTVVISSSDARNKRSYSFGVVGHFQAAKSGDSATPAATDAASPSR